MTRPRNAGGLAGCSAAGLALLPESVTERFASPVIRFVALEGSEATFRTAVVTHPDTDSLATLAFLRALQRTAGNGVAHGRATVELAA